MWDVSSWLQALVCRPPTSTMWRVEVVLASASGSLNRVPGLLTMMLGKHAGGKIFRIVWQPMKNYEREDEWR